MRNMIPRVLWYAGIGVLSAAYYIENGLEGALTLLGIFLLISGFIEGTLQANV